MIKKINFLFFPTRDKLNLFLPMGFLLIALGLPIAFSMMIVVFLGLTYIIGLDPALSMVGQVFFDNGMSYSLSILPCLLYTSPSPRD